MPPERIQDIAGFLQVITELVARAAYDTLRARQILELEKLRDDLIHMIVHDLRTPLTSILGGLETVVDTDYDPELTREFVPIAHASAVTLLEMVNTLLDINKMESGQMKLHLEDVDVGQVAATALDQVRGLAREHRHNLESAIDDACGTVRADGELLRRVMVNLLGNAIKFTPDGGEIRLEAGCHDGEVRVAVSDNGPGIPPEYQERIFQKFGQVETRKAGRKHSTGLGLTFCRMVAEAHGGRIWVDSEVGKGSTFTIAIPLVPAD
jgi:signal transduction histidine kinase